MSAPSKQPAPPDYEPFDEPPLISVIITTYDEERYDDFTECVQSVLSQTYDQFEVVIVTETAHARDRVEEDFAGHERVNHVHTDRSLNLASARNLGTDHADGDVYAFIDDDAVASEQWLATLADAYLEENVAAAGGLLAPDWPDTKPGILPAEFYWLVGITHRGFPEEPGWVRNTFGANISFRADVFHALGQFNAGFGKNHGHNLQAEETELCARIHDVYGEQLYYHPTARVDHKVYRFQLRWRWLLNRAYWQGYSKALMADSVPGSTSTERAFLTELFKRRVPDYVRQAVTERTLRPLASAGAALALTASVGAGFAAAKLPTP